MDKMEKPFERKGSLYMGEVDGNLYIAQTSKRLSYLIKEHGEEIGSEGLEFNFRKLQKKRFKELQEIFRN